LPPLEEFIPYLEKIWDAKILTNGGPFHQQLELELAEYLGVEFVSLFSNGTIALVAALKALKICGEVITTPYSFIATAHSLLWNELNPIFVDIDPDTFNIDPKKIEAAITPKTQAILAVHCYGYPCAVDAIEEVAKRNNLKVIYDAAHAFGVEGGDGSILKYGDLSVLSFHATKVFNVFEGGAVISRTAEMKRNIDQLKNFGFINETEIDAVGINGKLSELNSSFGLVQLKHVKAEIDKRKLVDHRYREQLSGVEGICLPNNPAKIENYSYFPIIVDKNFPLSRDELYEKLKTQEIYSRRYFYPLISNFSMYSLFESSLPSKLPIANRVADQILCLPIYSDLTMAEVDFICEQLSKLSGVV